MRVLGIETSCDDTSVALYDTAACTGDGCDLRETCERHLLIARRRAHVEAGGVAASKVGESNSILTVSMFMMASSQ